MSTKDSKDQASKFSDPPAEPKLGRRLFGEKLCPRCLSPLRVVGSLSGVFVAPQYVCDKCGYGGYVALERTQKE